MDRMVTTLDIAGQAIGPEHPCFVIAEAGVNHNGDLALARRLIEVAAQSGANAIKFQTFKTGKLTTPDAPKATYQQRATAAGESQYDMLRRLELSEHAHRELFDLCRNAGILFLSTPFEEESADFLECLGVSAFKIPSGELTNLPYLAHVAAKNKPLIVSTGMACLGEVETAVRTIEQSGNAQIILLHCTSAYPTMPEDVNLRAMHTLQAAFGYPTGYSDHTQGTDISLAAVALGACVIEKHFTLDRTLPGPDHAASVEPGELATLVSAIRRVESALGDGRKIPVERERNTADVARKSLAAAQDIPSGTQLTKSMITTRRPGTGISPARLSDIIGRTATMNIPSGTLITPSMIT